MKSENRKFITRDILLGILALPLVILLLSYFNTRPNNIKFNNPVKNDTIQNTTTTKENVSELSDTKNLEDSNKFYTIKAEYPIDAFDKEKSMENFVKYGFENNISPEIISHPANCRLLKHRDNNKKNIKCDITIEELLNKIKNW